MGEYRRFPKGAAVRLFMSGVLSLLSYSSRQRHTIVRLKTDFKFR